MNIFEACQKINECIKGNDEKSARDELIKLLDHHRKESIEYSQLVNHLIRETGLYPYIETKTAIWQDQYIFEVFKVDVGDCKLTLHREQSSLLKKLVEGKSIAVSAPTSFGKSFVIDAFIAINEPCNVVIIVPTIALMDETRRRLYKKFSDTYKIITTNDISLSKKNILVFPQERAVSYVNHLESIDLLVIDEFYKASSEFDKERSPVLIKAIMNLSKISRQRYYLAPNISEIKKNVFTQNMTFERLDFNTVYLEKHEIYEEIGKSVEAKGKFLGNFLNSSQNSKTLIYAGTYSEITKVSDIIQNDVQASTTPKSLLEDFGDWLSANYTPNWSLINLVRKGTGIHNGSLHRPLSQIQIQLFDSESGLNNIISTSSIIEGVNTAAENVVIWRNILGKDNLKDFSYKNIIGRGGRMFKHFIGKIYILEKPPETEETPLELPFPNELLGEIDEDDYKTFLTNLQIEKARDQRRKIEEIIGKANYKKLLDKNVLQTSDSELIYKIAHDMESEANSWKGLLFLNSIDPEDWDRFLYKFLYFKPGKWGVKYSKFVPFVKILSQNWQKSIPKLLSELKQYDIGIDKFFQLEREMAFNLAAIINDINEIQKVVFNENDDISPFVSKVSHAFLPSIVYQLEEYGLPRMLSKKIDKENIISLENTELSIHAIINKFNDISLDIIIENNIWTDFDKYILECFYDGISSPAPYKQVR